MSSGRHVLVGDLVHEGGVGAVLEQPAHQIGQQVGMRADRRIDAAARAFGLAHRLVQRLAHAVQALELEAVAILPAIDRMAATVCALCVANCG